MVSIISSTNRNWNNDWRKGEKSGDYPEKHDQEVDVARKIEVGHCRRLEICVSVKILRGLKSQEAHSTELTNLHSFIIGFLLVFDPQELELQENHTLKSYSVK
mmetsp:Transcript_25768/g.48042  ORF Transcript_25768/g.48042 Transcript_25768/m.48042 type:complete len:103 (-) Transcript_25768:1467-1775(-)